jgi:hypothetical protein
MPTTQVEKVAEAPALAASAAPPMLVPRLGLGANSPVKWFVATLLLLAFSGGLRFWRDHQFHVRADQSAACPFPLNEIPRILPGWHALEGADAQLEEETARVAGSSDHIIRVYQNDNGDAVSVLILYGLARTVFAHTPEYCYPGSGYKTVPGTVDRNLDVPSLDAPVRYRSSFFSKSDGGLTRYEEVLCTFRYNGSWVPETASKWKLFRYVPGMFKVQTQRRVESLSSENSPTESLVRELVSAIEARVSAGAVRQAQPAGEQPVAAR